MKKRKSKLIINGRHLSGPVGGVQRYLRESLLYIDTVVEPGEIKVAVPKDAEGVPEYKNIEVVRTGRFKGLLWEQLSYPWYMLTHGLKGVNTCTAVPLLYPYGIVVIHDVMPIRYKEVAKAFKPVYLLLLRMNYYLAAKLSDRILTVSETSRQDIIELYHVSPEKVGVMPSSWPHMKKIVPEEFAADYLTPGQFYLGLSSNRWQKNFVWIEKVAQNNPKDTFVIVGAEDNQQRVSCEVRSENVHYTGFLSDGQIKWLYMNCKAFLFPSICEGFGLPPLEALGCGARIIISGTSCLPEVYQDVPYYIDPYKYDYNMDEVMEEYLKEPDYEEKRQRLLDSYSWKRTGTILLNEMRKLTGEHELIDAD